MSPSVEAMQRFDALLEEYRACAHAEGREGRNHDTADGRAQRALHALREAFRNSTAPSPGTYRVYIATMRESHRVTYWTTLVSPRRDPNAGPLDTEGMLTPFMSKELWKAQAEADSWAEFLGVQAEPYEEPDWLKSPLPKPGNPA